MVYSLWSILGFWVPVKDPNLRYQKQSEESTIPCNAIVSTLRRLLLSQRKLPSKEKHNSNARPITELNSNKREPGLDSATVATRTFRSHLGCALHRRPQTPCPSHGTISEAGKLPSRRTCRGSS